jgi:hypothetical protein
MSMITSNAIYDPETRLDPRSESARFLNTILAGRWKVFDAAGGNGCDAVMLFRHGHRVTCNDLDSTQLAQAKGLADLHGASIEFSSHRWETMNDTIAPEETFDAIIVTRNAFAIAERAEQIRALTNFVSRLNSGGVLLIDERADAYSEIPNGYQPHAFSRGELLATLEKLNLQIDIYVDFAASTELPEQDSAARLITYVVHK